jgi:VanZ family protein
MNRSLLLRLALIALLATMGILALVPNSVLIQCYYQPWCALGLDPTTFGGHFRWIARAGHLLAFAALTVLLLRAACLRPWSVALTAVSFAGLLEASQVLSTTRTPRLADLLVSVTGVCLGMGVGRLTCNRDSRKVKS